MPEDRSPSAGEPGEEKLAGDDGGWSLEPVSNKEWKPGEHAEVQPEAEKRIKREDVVVADGLSLEPMASPKDSGAGAGRQAIRMFIAPRKKKPAAGEKEAPPAGADEKKAAGGESTMDGAGPAGTTDSGRALSRSEGAMGSGTGAGAEKRADAEGGPPVAPADASSESPGVRPVSGPAPDQRGRDGGEAPESVAPASEDSIREARKVTKAVAVPDGKEEAAEPADPQGAVPPFSPRRGEKAGKKDAPAANLETLPARLGRHTLLSELGSGSLGVVYRGIDSLNDQDVAVKVLKKDAPLSKSRVISDERRRAMFFDEVRAAAMMRHPYILRIFDMGEEEGLCYIVMELVADADTLRNYTKADELLPYEQVARLIRMCALALDHVHGRGVVHRDIKPENILVTRDGKSIKVADFGVAGLYRGEADSEEKSTEIKGSPKYMSPEQLGGHVLAGTSDFYSLGVILYEMLTGRHPFQARTLPELCKKIVSEQPLPISHYRDDAPPMLQSVVDRSLAKKAADRFQSGRELIEELRAIFPRLTKYAVFSDGVAHLASDLGQLGFFEEFDEQDLRVTAEICLREDYQPGMDIIEEGTMCDSVYIIVRGDVLVRKGAKELGRLYTGQCLGEMGYLTRIRRTATVTAVRKTCVVKFNFNLVSKLPPAVQLKFSRAFIRVLVDRLAHTTNQLMQG